jgi:hypothetical protein
MCHKCSFSYDEHIVLRETGYMVSVLKMEYTVQLMGVLAQDSAMRCVNQVGACLGGERGIFREKKLKYTNHLC